jgi:hypothetical protein
VFVHDCVPPSVADKMISRQEMRIKMGLKKKNGVSKLRCLIRKIAIIRYEQEVSIESSRILLLEDKDDFSREFYKK